ncbi:MAG TPA: basic amino acid ABC transporter substrate-binding protein [Firmicutes bacterium]|nr:basic amino acid ABC transporter substrate-binding protein [Bacillota bacterium]
MKPLSFVLLCLLCLAVGSGQAWAQQVLKVGSDITYPPFEFIDDKTKEPTGFDMDLIRAIGKVMGVQVQIINTAWDGIIPGLITGNYDVIISAMTITDERAAAISFSDPYFSTGQVIAVRKGSKGISEPAHLKGKRVGVQIGTTGHFAAEKVQGAMILTFQTMPEAFLALKAGQVDAVVADEMVAIEEMAANPGQTEIVGEPFTVEYYGIAVKKGRTDLLKKINLALAQLKVDGTYDAIYQKWFGVK